MASMSQATILITGAAGLVGNDLAPRLVEIYGDSRIIATDLKKPKLFDCIQEKLDVTDASALAELVQKYQVKTVYHLAGILSAGAEQNPKLGWQVNFDSLKSLLDIAKDHQLQVFWPSSIAAFGVTTPHQNVPQHTILEPTTMYGIAKVSGELMCQYYFQKHGVDVRSLRYPGVIGWRGKPGDGTTEYAVHIFHNALKSGSYECFLEPDTKLPMMYIDDTIRGTIELMEAEAHELTIRTSYNFAAISFTPAELAKAIQVETVLKIAYKPDFRQKIAESWPQSINDTEAQRDWGWRPEFDLTVMVKTMLEKLQKQSRLDE